MPANGKLDLNGSINLAIDNDDGDDEEFDSPKSVTSRASQELEQDEEEEEEEPLAIGEVFQDFSPTCY